MSEKEFIDALKKIGVSLTEEQKRQFREYALFLLKYNETTNLTAIRTMEEVYLKHFYDSILLCQYIDINGKTILDIGTGAGFPGIPLKICFPNITLTVLDSNGKKTIFLEKLKKVINIEYIVINRRAEEYVLEGREIFDIVTSRAVTAMPVLAELSLPFVKVGGYFIPYKGVLDESLEDGNYAIEALGGKVENVVSTSLPLSKGVRTFVFAKKKCQTSDEYPRRFDKITKKPLQKNK